VLPCLKAIGPLWVPPVPERLSLDWLLSCDDVAEESQEDHDMREAALVSLGMLALEGLLSPSLVLEGNDMAVITLIILGARNLHCRKGSGFSCTLFKTTSSGTATGLGLPPLPDGLCVDLAPGFSGESLGSEALGETALMGRLLTGTGGGLQRGDCEGVRGVTFPSPVSNASRGGVIMPPSAPSPICSGRKSQLPSPSLGVGITDDDQRGGQAQRHC